MTGGAFMFCTRSAFDAVGGFDERLYGAEDAAMCWALKREGRFVVLWNHVLTSGRRARGMGGLQMVGALLRMAFFPKMLTRRSAVGKVWYESNRESDNLMSSSLAIKLSNAILLVIMVLIITGPIWVASLAGAVFRWAAGDGAICLVRCWTACRTAALAVRIFSDSHFAQANALVRAVETDRFDRALLVGWLGEFARICRVLAFDSLVHR